LHEHLLPFEATIKQWVFSIKDKRRYGLVKKHAGYRRTDQEITKAAESVGFTLGNVEKFAYLIEFERSILCRKLIHSCDIVRNSFKKWGHQLPYIRMFQFKKSKD